MLSLVVLAQRIHPFPSRTRSLSSAARMVLPGRPGGRVRRRQHIFGPTSVREWALLFCPEIRVRRRRPDRSAPGEVGQAVVTVQPGGRTLRSGAESTHQRILFSRNASDALGIGIAGSVK